MADDDVPGILKIFFPLLYYGLSITMFAFLVMEHEHWDSLDHTGGGDHAKEYANAEYTITALGFGLVIVDFAATLIISGIKGTLMSTDIYKIEERPTDSIDIAQKVFRRLGVFGAYWAVFQFISGVHLQSKFYFAEGNHSDDVYVDLLPFLIPPVIGLLAVVLPSVTPGDYALVSMTGNYM